MPMDPNVATSLANEARKQELRAKLARLKGEADANASLAQSLASHSNDLTAMIGPTQAELYALEQGAGPGISDDFGPYSSTDQALRAERFAGKAAWVDFVKANPVCTEGDARPAYIAGALKARPADRQWLLHDVNGLRQEYTANLVAAGYIPDTSWESWRAFILATPRDVILGLS